MSSLNLNILFAQKHLRIYKILYNYYNSNFQMDINCPYLYDIMYLTKKEPAALKYEE